jgi:hypothetical protein
MNRKILSIVAATLLIGAQAGAHASGADDLRAEVGARGHIALSEIREQMRTELANEARAALPGRSTGAAAAAQLTDVAALRPAR